MTIKEFIEKAIEGGWQSFDTSFSSGSYFSKFSNGITEIENVTRYGIPVERILLDKGAWEAVGKVEEWGEMKINEETLYHNSEVQMHWHFYMHNMIDALIQGKSIEDYLKTL